MVYYMCVYIYGVVFVEVLFNCSILLVILLDKPQECINDVITYIVGNNCRPMVSVKAFLLSIQYVRENSLEQFVVQS